MHVYIVQGDIGVYIGRIGDYRNYNGSQSSTHAGIPGFKRFGGENEDCFIFSYPHTSFNGFSINEFMGLDQFNPVHLYCWRRIIFGKRLGR